MDVSNNPMDDMVPEAAAGDDPCNKCSGMVFLVVGLCNKCSGEVCLVVGLSLTYLICRAVSQTYQTTHCQPTSSSCLQENTHARNSSPTYIPDPPYDIMIRGPVSVFQVCCWRLVSLPAVLLQ